MTAAAEEDPRASLRGAMEVHAKTAGVVQSQSMPAAIQMSSTRESLSVDCGRMSFVQLTRCTPLPPPWGPDD